MSDKTARGLEIARKVFQQDIETLLTDYRAVQITTRMQLFYPLMSRQAVLDWVADNIGDEPVPFPCKKCAGTGQYYAGFWDGVPIASSLSDCPECDHSHHPSKPTAPDGTWAREGQQP